MTSSLLMEPSTVSPYSIGDHPNQVSQQSYNKAAVASAFDRAARTYDSHAKVQRQAADWLLSSVPKRLYGQHYLDVGCGTGYVAKTLIERGARVTCLDLSPAMLTQAKMQLGCNNIHYVQGDAEALPFADGQFDGVVSSLALQWCSDLRQPLGEFERVLRPQGRGRFTTLVDGSLSELKQAWSNIDSHQHVNTFSTLNQINLALEQISPRANSLHCLPLIAWYDSALALMKDLKGIGATHVAGRSNGLTSMSRLRELERHYQQFAQPQGLPATYQVCLGIV